ncbi:hypothetical protein LWF15_23160 [Kineosporia rhizophila]|uniref:hypothetical protein n=1 Tax=Kineosporia TaxID=49184 RepID=UPI001E5B366B|nr:MULTISPECIES: hypothetical protein [Kineosporia]MCE0538402.1 hypothetical protein [Kineosporia rhizophila]
MRRLSSLVVALLALATLVLLPAAGASAKAEVAPADTVSAQAWQHTLFCNRGVGIEIHPYFLDGSHMGWIKPGNCAGANLDLHRAFSIEVVRPHTGERKTYRGFVVRCHTEFTVSGTYQATRTPTLCA